MKRPNGVIKLIFFICFATFANPKVVAQNLVPNPSFEDTSFCPFALSQLYAANNWLNFGITPDYYNSCNTTFGANIPNTFAGYQYAHSGDGMAGFIIKSELNNPIGPNAREYLGIQLLDSLIVGSRYYFSCYINFTHDIFGGIACNKFGMKVSIYSYDSTQYLAQVNDFAHIHTDSIITDTVQWFNLRGSFIADVNYKYLILGNFWEDSQVSTISYGTIPSYSYYFVDDVCLSLDSTYCDNWTSIPSIASTPESKPKIISSFDQITISSEQNIKTFRVYNNLGQIVYDRKGIKEKQATISTNGFSTGIYFVQVKLENEKVYNLKVFRQ